MMQPILSIVIPVYNVAAYIDKCVHSCFNQNVDKSLYEVILVNDGSTDNSLEKCKSLKIKFQNIKIISQDNKGLSGARNTGFKSAVGEYVWFVDSDDWIETNCLSNIIKKTHSNIDIIWLGHDIWHLGKPVQEYVPAEISNPVSGEEFFKSHLNNLFYIWKFIYKREFLNTNNLSFAEGLLYEDLEFTPRALLYANRCITIPKIFYHYLVREGSIANNINKKNIEHRFLILNRLADSLYKANISNSYKNTLSQVILHTIEGTIDMAARANVKIPESGFNIINKLKQNAIFNSGLSLKMKIIKIVPRFYYSAFKIAYNIYKMLSLKSK